MNLAKETELPYARIRYEAPVVYYIYQENIELGFPEIRELVSRAEQLSGNKPYVTFADVRGGISITNEGKRMLEDPRNMPLFRGTAALVSSGLYKLAANFMNQYSKRQYPFRAFTSEQEAIEWLRSLPLD
jgi:hypothetical protein